MRGFRPLSGFQPDAICRACGKDNATIEYYIETSVAVPSCNTSSCRIRVQEIAHELLPPPKEAPIEKNRWLPWR